jgi:hypothetical protein
MVHRENGDVSRRRGSYLDSLKTGGELEWHEVRILGLNRTTSLMRNNGRLSEMPMAVWVQKLPPPPNWLGSNS